jgi:hypothetical protein
MRSRRALATAVVITAALLAAVMLGHLDAQQTTDPAIRIGATDLGGVVTSANGSEAGVWVIAETTDLPTKYVKIVVTDDRGRYVLPELPKATCRRPPAWPCSGIRPTPGTPTSCEERRRPLQHPYCGFYR